jgi:ABC-2 type transport system ATP-binding protein
MKIEVKNVCKSFKIKKVINNVNITFESGKTYGIVGKKGSGKSVFLKILCSFYIPDSGTITQDGYDYINNNEFPKDTRALIERPDFISDLTGFQNLKLIAQIQNKITDKKILETIEKVNLIEEKDKYYYQYSFGEKQKLGIAQVLMENPRFIILDEPFIGIDSASVLKIKQIIKELKKDRIIIITSHIEEDILELADEVYEFNAGELLKNDKY